MTSSASGRLRRTCDEHLRGKVAFRGQVILRVLRIRFIGPFSSEGNTFGLLVVVYLGFVLYGLDVPSVVQ